MIAAILSGLLQANLAAGAAVLLVLAARRIVRAWFGARAAYALWLAPLAAAAAVLLPHPQIATPIGPIVARAETAASSMAEAFTVEAPAAAAQANTPDAATLTFGLWLAGALAAAALVAWRQSRFTRAMGRLTASDTPRLFWAQSSGVGPAVVGVFRPRIVAPADFEARFAPAERALILAHEHVHLASGDAGINALACALSCLSWFNPLVHLGARALRIDQELACDAAVVGAFPQARRAYAELLLKTQIATQPLPLGCHWPAGAEHPLKERIAMLKSPLPASAMRAIGLAVAAGLTLGVGGLAWAAQPSHLEPAQADKLVKPGEAILCKPDANRELHNCEIKGSPFASIATAADVQREWPTQAKKAGLTGWVMLQCAPNLSVGRFEGCRGYHYGGAAERPDLQAAFEQAAVRVISVIRLKTKLTAHDDVLPPAGLYTIEFNDHPRMPGDLPSGPPVTHHFPDFLPVVPTEAKAPLAKVSQAAPPARHILAAYQPTAEGGVAPVAFHSAWLQKPTGEDMARFYPAEALAKGLTGDVVMSCRVGADGRLSGCAIVRAEVSGDNGAAPAPDPGFGAASLELAKLFQMEPTNAQGFPTNGVEIRIPIRFALPRGFQPAASPS